MYTPIHILTWDANFWIEKCFDSLFFSLVCTFLSYYMVYITLEEKLGKLCITESFLSVFDEVLSKKQLSFLLFGKHLPLWIVFLLKISPSLYCISLYYLCPPSLLNILSPSASLPFVFSFLYVECFIFALFSFLGILLRYKSSSLNLM